MGSAWVEHVKSVYAKGKKNGMSYKQAMQKAKASWAKKKGKTATKGAAPAKKKKASKAAADDDDEKVTPKRAKKKARKQAGGASPAESQTAADEPQSSKKARSSRASRKTKSIKRRDVAPKGIAGVGAPYKE